MSSPALVVNLWDDYADDEDGARQSTYAYVEDEASDAECKSALEGFQGALSEWSATNAPTVTTELVWHEPLKVYPHMVGSGMEAMFQPSWRVTIQHLTHADRERFVDHMASQGPVLPLPIQVISES